MSSVLAAISLLIPSLALWILSVALVLLMCSILIFILLYLLHKLYRKRKIKKLNTFYSDLISEIVLAESHQERELFICQPSARPLLDEIRKHRYAQELLIDELVLISRAFSGTALDNIQWIYSHLKLDTVTKRQLQSGRWHQKAKAVQTLSQLKFMAAIELISPLAGHSNYHVRAEAQLAAVRLKGFNGLHFLNQINYQLPDWQQISLLHELVLHGSPDDKDIAVWLTSVNNSVVEFTLRAIETFRLAPMYEHVRNCLCHPSTLAQLQAVKTLKSLWQPGAAIALRSAFPSAAPNVQLAIITVLYEMGNDDDLAFFIPLLNHHNPSVRLKAAFAIQGTGAHRNEVLQKEIDTARALWPLIHNDAENSEAA